MINREDAEAMYAIEQFNGAKHATKNLRDTYFKAKALVVEKTWGMVEAQFNLALAERNHHQSFLQEAILRNIDLSQALKPSNPSLVIKDYSPDNMSMLLQRADQKGLKIKIEPISLPNGTQHSLIEFIIY